MNLSMLNISNKISYNATSCGDEPLMIFVLPIISLICIVLNLLCIIIFSMIIHKESNNLMFIFGHKCFLAKSIHDFMQFIFQIFTPIYYCKEQCGSISKSFISQIWYIYFFNFAETINEFSSAFFEVASLLECYTMINNYINVLKKISFGILFMIVLLWSICQNISILFRFSIVPISDKNEFRVERTDYYNTKFDTYLRFIEIFIRDILSFILILILYILIYLTVRDRSKQKRKISRQGRVESNGLKNADNAKNKILTMSILNSLIYVICRLPLIVYYLPYEKNSNPIFWSCFYNISLLPFYLSYSHSFFIYFFYNNNFKHNTMRLFGRN
jgi:hypothetical protein